MIVKLKNARHRGAHSQTQAQTILLFNLINEKGYMQGSEIK